MENHTLQELIEFVRGKNVYIQTHNYPDPDAIASAFGMGRLLEHFGIGSTLCYHGAIDRINTKKMVDLLDINIVSKDSLEGIMKEEDPIICVDSQKFGGNIMDLIGDEVACIDHHPTQKQVDYFYKDVRILGSCSTIIASYFEELGVEPDYRTATALLYGLKMDTSGFSRGVKEEDIHAFAFLNKNADGDIIQRLEQNQMEFEDLKAFGAAISDIVIDGEYGFATIPFACPDALIAIACDFILSLEEVEVAIVYSCRDDGYKFSVRSEAGGVHSGRLVSLALDGMGSGGGHSFMAGGFLPLSKAPAEGNELKTLIKDKFMDAARRLEAE